MSKADRPPATLRCADPGCGRPWATLRDGVLEVESRHGGETHVNRIAVSELVRLWLGGEAMIVPIGVPVAITGER